MTDEMKQRIDAMTREEMARQWRFAPMGDPMFQGETGDYFGQRFRELGGFSPAISKDIGWDKP
jgi:zona occludens toxin (predicted ATPase)